jgi:hypothetical protein
MGDISKRMARKNIYENFYIEQIKSGQGKGRIIPDPDRTSPDPVLDPAGIRVRNTAFNPPPAGTCCSVGRRGLGVSPRLARANSTSNQALRSNDHQPRTRYHQVLRIRIFFASSVTYQLLSRMSSGSGIIWKAGRIGILK